MPFELHFYILAGQGRVCLHFQDIVKLRRPLEPRLENLLRMQQKKNRKNIIPPLASSMLKLGASDIIWFQTERMRLRRIKPLCGPVRGVDSTYALELSLLFCNHVIRFQVTFFMTERNTWSWKHETTCDVEHILAYQCFRMTNVAIPCSWTITLSSAYLK